MIELVASRFALDYCERFRVEIRNLFTDAERNATPEENFRARVTELEVGRFLKMKWSELKDLLDNPAQHDVVNPHGLRGDVKASSSENGNTLFWPRDKWKDFHARQFDWLGFCNTYRFPVIEFRGFVLKAEFEKQHAVAGADHHLMENTPYWPKPLRDPTQLLGPMYFNNHACSVCGAPDVVHGFSKPSASLHEIEWRCREHW